MIVLQTTVQALRKFMTPTSWDKYARAHGIRDPLNQDGPLITDTEDLKQYEVTPELQQLMVETEKLDAEFKAMGFTLDPM